MGASALGASGGEPPGLACRENFKNGYDCLIAFVKPNDMTQTIKIRRFKVAPAFNRYTVDFDSDTMEYTLPSSSGQTASQIAMWHHYGTNLFHIAHQSTAVDQKLVIHKASGDGAIGWQLVNSAFDHAVYGPSNVSVKSNSTMPLVWVK
jgi:hypothetical protein